MKFKKYIPLLLSIISIYAINGHNGAILPYEDEITLPVEKNESMLPGGHSDDVYEILPVEDEEEPLLPMITPEGHVTFPLPQEPYEKPLIRYPSDFIEEQKAIDDMDIVLPILRYDEHGNPILEEEEGRFLPIEEDTLPYNPKKSGKSKWHSNKNWHQKNKYGNISILPYKEDGNEEFSPAPSGGSEGQILPIDDYNNTDVKYFIED